ncbi:MAG TPA: magnesium transporter, partial [Dongiaceae bacterium]|nr:magnesium transporter [Dongiaceae bacterium]
MSEEPGLKDTERTPIVETVDEEELYGPSQELLENVKAALNEADIAQVEALIEPLHPADVADLIEHLDPEERRLFLEITRHVIEPETISHLEDTLREEVVETMRPEELAEVVTGLDTDDAVDILEDLEPDRQQQVLESLPQEERTALEEGLTYPEDSAGRLMQKELVAIPLHWTVGETIDYLRSAKDLPDDFYSLYVVDRMNRPVG